MKRQPEKGVALILTMILLLVMSVMAISLTFIARSETWSSMNYRVMSQTRDVAEAGVNNTANYLMGASFSPLPTTYYTPPGTATDPLTNYNISAYPVQNGATNTSGNDVILSASSTSSNYPISSVQSAYNTSGVGKGTVSAGNTTINFATSAKLLWMQQLGVSVYNPSATTIQSWEITSQGTISGVPAATEQVTAILERPAVAVFGYAAFATNNGCNALQFGGGGSTNSYTDNGAMTTGSNPVPVTSNTDGNVGTNGNLSTQGNSTTINGNLSSPRTGVGSCTSGNITAYTFNAQGNQLNGSMIELPQAVNYPTPTIPAPGTTDVSVKDGCGTLAGCNVVGSGKGTMHLSSGAANSIGNISLNGNTNLYIGPGTYNINSLTESGQGAIQLEDATSCAPLLASTPPIPCTPVDATHPVILQVTGNSQSTPIDLTGGGVINNSTTFDPSTFQILYAGTGTVKLKGGAAAVGTLYAPNASYSFGGGGDWYGAVIGGTLTDMGGASIHYDRKLKDKFYVPGNYMLSSFTWNKY